MSLVCCFVQFETALYFLCSYKVCKWEMMNFYYQFLVYISWFFSPHSPCLSGMSTFCWLQTRYQCMLWNCWWPWLSTALLLWGNTTTYSLLFLVPSVSISPFLLGISNNRSHYCTSLTSTMIWKNHLRVFVIEHILYLLCQFFYDPGYFSLYLANETLETKSEEF